MWKKRGEGKKARKEEKVSGFREKIEGEEMTTEEWEVESWRGESTGAG